MSEISSFRFWCQKVLPAVYDDSLSYYELLCKVVTKLNEVINSQNGTNDHVTELAQQFEQLKNELQGTIESEAEKVVDNYVKSNNLVKSINGITALGATGEVTLQASDVGAIANVSDSVKENNIKDGSVTSGKIATGAVGSEKIAQDAVTASKLANGSVDTAKIQNGAVTAEKLAQDAVPVKSVNGKTGEVQITAEEIGALPNSAGSVGTTNLQDGAVTGDKIGAGAVDTAKVKDGSVTADKLAPGAIPVKSVNAKTGEVVLSADDVGAIPSADGSVTTKNLADENVTTAKIKNGNVTYAKIADEAIAESKIRNGSVSEQKIASYAVTNPKIAIGTITPDRMAAQGVKNAGKLLKIGADGKPAWLSGEGTVTAGVESVNGKDGVVTLGAADVGAIKANANALKSSDINVGAESKFLDALKEIYPNASPESPVRLYYYGFPPLDFTGSSLKPVPGLPSAYIWNSTDLRGLRLANIPLATFISAPDNTTISFKAEHPVYMQFVKSVNQKTGDVTLTADDIDGALKEVAPSDMLTGNSVVGAYLFLAPADGSTDAFQKIDKLPEKMLPMDIDGSLLKDGTVGTSKLVGLSVTTEKIGNGAVSGAKLAANSVSTACVQDGAVTLPKLNQPGTAESGKVLGVSSAGQWELQAMIKGGEWEEIPATSLIDGATVHCRIQPGTGWLWFSIDSDTNIAVAAASTESASSAYKLWGTINVNVCNSPVPTNGTSASGDAYTWERNGLHMSKVSSWSINGTTVKKITAFSVTPLNNLTPILRVARNNTGVTAFGLSNTGTSTVSANHAEFYVSNWFDNRTIDGTNKYPRV